MTKKAIAASALILAAAIAIPVFAQTTTPAPTSTITTTVAARQPILEVGAAGKVLMRGTIVSISTGSLTVTSWGGTWTVNVGSGAQILPGNDMTQFKTGDFVGVQGTVSQSANWTINATLIRDWVYRAAVTQEQKQNVQSAQGIRSGYPKDYVGTASGVGGSSFTLNATASTSYTVNVASGAEVVNTKWITIPLASINNGDKVRVYGVNASGTITAQIVRDVTISATSTTK